MQASDQFELVVGLEVHAQLKTSSKLFCSDATAFGAAPNTQVSPVSLAHPGTLPVMNEKAIELAVKLGVALNCDIEQHNYFARKNYFYPDLPKGYQVSQHTAPICKGGWLSIKSGDEKKQIALNRIHIEEDAGKSIHDNDPIYTSVDLNRAGVPLVEIVTEPVIHSAEDAFAFLTELRRIVRWLDVCDGNMEEGSLRCDANISVRPKGSEILGTRVEVKNLNSIRHVKKAIEIEAARLTDLTLQQKKITQETRSFDAASNITFSLRNKEEAEDYRYFPEPDLPPFNIMETYIRNIRETMPVLPEQLALEWMTKYGLSEYDAAVICADKADADFYLSLVEKTDAYKPAANWMIGPLKQYCNDHNISADQCPVSVDKIAAMIKMTASGLISFNNASGKLFSFLAENPESGVEDAAQKLNLLQESDSNALEQWIDETIAAMPDKVKEFRSGKKSLLGLFAGEVKKKSKGKADMQQVTKMLQEKLSS